MVSAPYCSMSSVSRSRATTLEAMKPLRSNPTICGWRVMFMIMRQTSLRNLPFSMMRMGGIISPSCCFSVARTDTEPTAMPPISTWCAVTPAQATRRPSKNSGAMMLTSGWCTAPL